MSAPPPPFLKDETTIYPVGIIIGPRNDKNFNPGDLSADSSSHHENIS